MTSKTLDGVLVKRANIREEFNEQQVTDLVLCSDPVSGYLHFVRNFFYIQHPTRGKILYDPYDYQIRLLNSYHKYRFNINMLPRQSGKSTTAAGYLLWYAMFHPDQTILVAAHKFTGAQEIMQRIRYGYELCPNHIRSGVTSYNKGSIEFDNGSRIVSATTTDNTGRGMSISLLYCLDGDTSFVKIRHKETLVEEEISLKQLFISISTGLCDHINIRQKCAQNTVYEILAPNGWEDFDGVICNKGANKPSRTLTFEDGSIITATLEHRFFVNKQEIKVCDLQAGDSIDGDSGPRKIVNSTPIILEDTYDIFNAKNHVIVVNGNYSHNCDEFSYVNPNIAGEFWASISPTLSTGGRAIITSTPNSDEDTFATIWKEANKKFDEHGNETALGINGFHACKAEWWEHPDRDENWKNTELGRIGEERFRREFNCEFIIDDETLINTITLAGLTGVEPKFKTGHCRWYKQPTDQYSYVIALDPSLGTGGNFAAIQVIELPSMVQVAEWCSNDTAIEGQIKIIRDINRYIAECCPVSNGKNIYWSVENNTVGEAALVVIKNLGEENIPGLLVAEPLRKGHVRKFRKGFNTTHRTKISACSRLKHLIESNKLKINSKPLVSELKAFISSGISFKAKSGDTDDLVSALLLSIRISAVLADWDAKVFEAMTTRFDEESEFDPPMPIFVSRM